MKVIANRPWYKTVRVSAIIESTVEVPVYEEDYELDDVMRDEDGNHSYRTIVNEVTINERAYEMAFGNIQGCKITDEVYEYD